MSNFVSFDRDTLFLMPPSVQDWLPEKHLARFTVELVSRLDLRSIRDTYTASGSAAYHPEMLTALLFYAYATGMRASRKIENGTYDSVAFRYIAANTHPDHDTIASFRRRFLPHLQAAFNQILVLAKELNCLKVGRVSLDGTKIKASASKHRSMSLEGSERLKTRLRREVERMFELAEEADRSDEAAEAEMDFPKEIERREDRLKAISEAQERIRVREAERQAQDKEEHEEILADRDRIEKGNGKKLKSRPPERRNKGIRPGAQLNLTDADSRIMPSHEGFVQGYNAQAAVDTDSMLIVAATLSQKATDRRLLKPMLRKLDELPVGRPDAILADAGYFSELNVELCVESGFTPYIVPKRDKHHWGLRRWKIPQEPRSSASALTKMLHRLRTPEGRNVYALRKCTVEPVFGILKRAMGFRQFLLRGHQKASGEYLLACTAWNIKRLNALVAT